MISKESLLNYELANFLFEYVPDGTLRWKNPRARNRKKGATVGGRRKDGRQQVMLHLEGKSYLFLIYRIIWLLHNKEWPKNTIDHINGDATDDRIENLRDISQKGNNENRHSALSTNSTGVLGVHICRNKYRANIGITGEDGVSKQVYLGVFDDIQSAEQAYSEAKKKYHKFE